jgi:hypothetical protein
MVSYEWGHAEWLAVKNSLLVKKEGSCQPLNGRIGPYGLSCFSHRANVGLLASDHDSFEGGGWPRDGAASSSAWRRHSS